MPGSSLFFYGLYMDPGVRAAKGARCSGDQPAVAENQRILLGGKSTITPARGAKVWGIVAEADREDLRALYAGEDMRGAGPRHTAGVGGGATHRAPPRGGRAA